MLHGFRSQIQFSKQLMDLINTSISTINQCWQIQIANKYNSFGFQLIIDIILVVFVPLDVIFVVIPFIILVVITFQKWRNPAKIYYYSIIICNIITLIFLDINSNFITIFGIIYYYFTIPVFLNFANILYSLNILLFYKIDILCRTFNLLTDLGPLCGYWTTGIFAIHRMFVVLYPLHVYKLKRLFNKWTLIICLTLVSFLFIPDFWLFHQYINASGTSYCLPNTAGLSFWSIYYSQLNYIKYIGPCIIITISIAVICVTIIKSKNRRSILNQQNRQNRLDNPELRSTVVLITLGVCYTVFSIPYTIAYILNQFLNPISDVCNLTTYFIYLIVVTLLASFQTMQIITRVADGIIIFLMVPKFRQVCNDLVSLTFQNNHH